jgi:hypothetical protein
VGPLLTSLLLAAPCFVPEDATPGWKQAALPREAPALAAPAGVPQFRSGEWLAVVDDRSELYLAGVPALPGSTRFDFELGAGGRSLELRFEQPLRGAKVDVSAWGPSGPMTLLHEQRVGASTLTLAWGANDVESVSVRVHQHLREPPVVRGLRSVRRLRASALPLGPPFKLARSLYYLQPPGQPVRLCQEPDRSLELPPGAPAPGEEPTPVSLRPAPPG